MKKFVSFLFIIAGLFVLIGFSGIANASTTPKLYMDGKQLVTDVDPIIRQGTTLVPLAVLSSGLGYEVKWDNSAKQVSVIDKDLTIKLTIGQKIGYVNDKSYELIQVPSLEKNRTMVPIRFVSEVLGYKVEWKQKTAEVLLTSPVKVPTPDPSPSPSPTPTTEKQEATITGVLLSENGNLHISYDGALPDPKVMLLPKDDKNPNRLVVDLNKTSFTYELSKSFIGGQTNVSLNGYLTMTGYRYAQFSKDPLIARIVVLLEDDVTYKVYKTSSEVIISFNDSEVDLPEEILNPSDEIKDGNEDNQVPGSTPDPNSPDQFVFHIVLDPGHGDTDPGAVNKQLNLREKDFNLSAALKLKAELEKNKNVKVHLTRSDDTYLELSERVAFAENIPGVNKKADLFISIHANSYDVSTVNGTETYYLRENSKELAQALHPKIVNAVGLNDRGVRTASFKVIRETTMPAVLLEVGYLSNESDAKVLFNEETQAKFATETADAIFTYLKLK